MRVPLRDKAIFDYAIDSVVCTLTTVDARNVVGHEVDGFKIENRPYNFSYFTHIKLARLTAPDDVIVLGRSNGSICRDYAVFTAAKALTGAAPTPL